MHVQFIQFGLHWKEKITSPSQLQKYAHFGQFIGKLIIVNKRTIKASF